MDLYTNLQCSGEPYNSAEEAWDDEFDPMEETLLEFRRAAKALPNKELIEEYGKAEDAGKWFWTTVLADEISWRNGVKKAECFAECADYDMGLGPDDLPE